MSPKAVLARSFATGSTTGTAAWVAEIAVAVIEPFRGYATGLADRLDATIVIDHFHAIRLAHSATDDARRRVQQETLGHRGRRDDPLYRIRRRLLVGHERLTGRPVRDNRG